MIVYVDKSHRFRTEPTDGCREMDLPFFDGKCKEFIEGHMFLFEGETWTNDEGEIFEGEMMSTWMDSAELIRLQQAYEKELIHTYEESLKTVGVVL